MIYKKTSTKKLRNILAAIWIFIVLLSIFLVLNIEETQNNIAESKTNKTHERIIIKLDNYFEQIEGIVNMASDHLASNYLGHDSIHGFKSYFGPILNYSPNIKYVVLADSIDIKQVLFKENKHIVEVLNNTKQQITTKYTWQIKPYDNWLLVSSEDYNKSGRNFHWIKGAYSIPNRLFWTNPFTYATGEVGMTVTKSYENYSQQKTNIIGLGLTVNHISDIIKHTLITDNGEAFILTSDNNFVSVPDKLTSKTKDHNSIIHLDDSPLIKEAYNVWARNITDKINVFQFNNKTWYVGFTKFKLSDDFYFNVGVIIPQKDIIGEMQKVKTSIIASAIFLLILISLILYYYGLTHKTNTELVIKNAQISLQKQIIEQKNNNILESIKYAKHIQQAMLPTEKYIKDLLADYFIIFKPKDVISGDFYWIEQKGDTIYFAAADATGHGVPGSLVSSICNRSLHLSLREYNQLTPNEILNKTRELVISEFSKGDEILNDGMDIALCSINGNTLQYSGANRPLWIVRDNIIIETKPNKQPIGNYNNTKPYTNHKFKLQKGDTVYIFSDGFADQFGGERNKKFKTRQLKNLLCTIQHKSLKKQKQDLELIFEEWKGEHEQTDDICLLAYRHNKI